MLKKVAILVLLLGLAFAVLMLVARDATFSQEESVAIDSSPKVVWDALTDVAHWTDWWPGMEKALLSGDLREGGQLDLVLKGNPQKDPARISAFLRGREMAWDRPGVLGSRSRTRLRLMPAEGETVVTMETAIYGPQSVLARVTGAAEFSRYQETVLESLKAHLEKNGTIGERP